MRLIWQLWERLLCIVGIHEWKYTTPTYSKGNGRYEAVSYPRYCVRCLTVREYRFHRLRSDSRIKEGDY